MKHRKENKSFIQIDKRLTPKEAQTLIDKEELPIYKNVLVSWSGKNDLIIFKIVDYIIEHYPDQLSFAFLDKDDLELVWINGVPRGFNNSKLSTVAGYKLIVDSI